MEAKMTLSECAFSVCDNFQDRPLHAAPARARMRDESPRDVRAREALLDEALGSGRLLKTCERLRTGRLPAKGLALLATKSERLVGSIRLWNIRAGARPALLLGPLGVAADCRSQGIGARLIAEALFRAVCQGHSAILLVGDAPYYGRFGFEKRLVRGLRMPGPVELDRFLGLELVPGALADAEGLVVATGAREAPVSLLPEAESELRAA
jgi:predicted N-acetyltransferase YhbS